MTTPANRDAVQNKFKPEPGDPASGFINAQNSIDAASLVYDDLEAVAIDAVSKSDSGQNLNGTYTFNGTFDFNTATITLRDPIPTDGKYPASVSYVDTASHTLNTKFNDYTTTSDLNTNLGNYATSASLNTRLGDYATSASLNTRLGNYATTASVSSALLPYAKSADVYTKSSVYTKTESNAAFRPKGAAYLRSRSDVSFSVAPNAPLNTNSGTSINTPKFSMSQQNATGNLYVNLDSVFTGTGVFTVSAYVTLSLTAPAVNVQVWSVYGNASNAMKLWHPLAGENAHGAQTVGGSGTVYVDGSNNRVGAHVWTNSTVNIVKWFFDIVKIGDI